MSPPRRKSSTRLGLKFCFTKKLIASALLLNCASTVGLESSNSLTIPLTGSTAASYPIACAMSEKPLGLFGSSSGVERIVCSLVSLLYQNSRVGGSRLSSSSPFTFPTSTSFMSFDTDSGVRYPSASTSAFVATPRSPASMPEIAFRSGLPANRRTTRNVLNRRSHAMPCPNTFTTCFQNFSGPWIAPASISLGNDLTRSVSPPPIAASRTFGIVTPHSVFERSVTWASSFAFTAFHIFWVKSPGHFPAISAARPGPPTKSTLSAIVSPAAIAIPVSPESVSVWDATLEGICWYIASAILWKSCVLSARLFHGLSPENSVSIASLAPALTCARSEFVLAEFPTIHFSASLAARGSPAWRRSSIQSPRLYESCVPGTSAKRPLSSAARSSSVRGWSYELSAGIQLPTAWFTTFWYTIAFCESGTERN